MKIKGYNRIKKIDIKKWLLGGNSKIYAVILLLFLAAVLFVFKTVTSLRSQESSETVAERLEDETTGISKDYVAENQKYLIKINKSKNFITVYTLDDQMQFTTVYDTFLCSVNKSVNTGETSISDKSIWYKINSSAYGHYADHLENGAWLYSVPYYSQDSSKLNVSLYNSLGKASQTGSIYMEAGHAKWIYENCGNGTKVEIYEDDQENLPDSLLEFETLSSGALYDPSDRPQTLEGACATPINYMNVVKGKVVKIGEKFDPMEGASAFDIYGADITSYIQVVGTVDVTKVGVYPLYYNISDNYGKSLSYYREVTVTE